MQLTEGNKLFLRASSAIAWLTSVRTHVAEFGGVDETVGGVVFCLTYLNYLYLV